MSVTPAKAGVQERGEAHRRRYWISAFAGMTDVGWDPGSAGRQGQAESVQLGPEFVKSHMRRVLACVLACLVGFQPAVVWAQQGAAASAPVSQHKPRPPGSSQGQPPPDFDALGVSFDRIKRELRLSPPSTVKTPLKLEFYVEVHGTAPPILLFKPGELTTGPVPYGAPTHSDVLELFTPIEFRSPSMPLSTIAIWGIQKLLAWEVNRERERRAEEALQKRNEAERVRQQRLKESLVVSPPK